MKRTRCYVAALALLLGAVEAQGQVGPASWSDVPTDPVAGVAHRTFPSLHMKSDVGYSVFLPPGYEQESRDYPVLYWLHGRGGNENSGPRFLAPVARAAMTSGALPPFIIVFVNGGPATFFADSYDGVLPVETMLISELIPHIDATYRTVAERRGRAIEGFSMGGFGALALGFKHAAMFGSVAAYAPALLDAKPLNGVLTLTRPVPGSGAENVELNLRSFQVMFDSNPTLFDQYSPWALVPRNAGALSEVLPVRIIVGTADRLFATVDLFHDVMTENHYAHEYFVLKDVAHDLAGLYTVVGAIGLQYHARAGGWQ